MSQFVFKQIAYDTIQQGTSASTTTRSSSSVVAGGETFSNRDASQEADNENAQVHVVSLGESLG
jgi:hypothetical protein